MTENWTCSVKSLFVFRVSRFVVSVEYNAHDTRIKKIIGAENPYWKTGTINQHENRACPIRYRTLISKIRYKTACQTRQKPVPVFCYRFWRRFPGISLEALEKLRAVLDRRQIAVQCQVDWSSAVRRLHDPEASRAVMRGIWRAAGAAAAAAAANVI